MKYLAAPLFRKSNRSFSWYIGAGFSSTPYIDTHHVKGFPHTFYVQGWGKVVGWRKAMAMARVVELCRGYVPFIMWTIPQGENFYE